LKKIHPFEVADGVCAQLDSESLLDIFSLSAQEAKIFSLWVEGSLKVFRGEKFSEKKKFLLKSGKAQRKTKIEKV
jgi:hypothetical protein